MSFNTAFKHIILELDKNRSVFERLLSDQTEAVYTWKQAPEKWCMLEIICHLYDEEREDFRARTRFALETPLGNLPPIDPVGWVESRNYMMENYAKKLDAFLEEREKSVAWLKTLADPKWDNAYIHPKFGQMTAKMFMSNWLAHDLLHIRQIVKLQFDYLKHVTSEELMYAGNW